MPPNLQFITGTESRERSARTEQSQINRETLRQSQDEAARLAAANDASGAAAQRFLALRDVGSAGAPVPATPAPTPTAAPAPTAPVAAPAAAAAATAPVAAAPQSLRDITASELLQRGQGAPALTLLQQQEDERRVAEEDAIDRSLDFAAEGNGAAARAVLEQAGADIPPAFGALFEQAAFLQDYRLGVETIIERFGNDPAAADQAFGQLMEQLGDMHAAGDPSQLPVQGFEGVERTPPVPKASDFEFVQDAQGNFFRVNKLTNQAEPLTSAGQPIAGKAPGADNQREREIADLLERGFTEAEAQDIANKRLRVSRDPLTGEAGVVNIATNELTRPTPTGGQAAPQTGAATEPGAAGAETSGRPKTVFETIGDAVGLVSTIKRVGSGPSEQAGGPIAKAEVDAKSVLNKLSQEIRAAFALSGRPTVFEQKLILENVPSGIAEGEKTSILQLRVLHEQLSANLRDDRAYASRTDVPPKGRAEALSRARSIETVLRTLGEPPPLIPEMSIEQLKELDLGDLDDDELQEAIARAKFLQDQGTQ